MSKLTAKQKKIILVKLKRARKGKRRSFGPMNKKSHYLQFKTYSYQFKLRPQFLLNGTGGPGSLSYGLPSSGQTPLIPSQVAVFPSLSGILGMYDIAFATNHMFADLANAGAYQAMYDAYKIGKVKLQLQWLNNVTNPATPGILPTVYHYYDADDATTPPSTISITSKQGVIIRQFGNRMQSTLNFAYTPIPLLDATTTSIIPKSRQWVDCAQAGVKHNALKVYIADVYLPGNAVPNFSNGFRLQWEYNLSFRAPILAA